MGLIVLKDKTEFKNSILADSSYDRSLMLTIPENDIVKYAVLFGDPEKTKAISYTSGFFTTIYEGYTVLKSITDVPEEGRTIVRLGAKNITNKRTEYAVPEEYVPEELRIKEEKGENNNA